MAWSTVRDAHMRFLLTAVRDAGYGCRVLWRSPSYAAVVILTIALGIGVNVAIFSVVHAVLWKSLPYPDAGRIVAFEADTRDTPSSSASSKAVFDVREASRAVTHVAHVEGRDAMIEIDGAMERAPAARATDDLLPLLGAPVALGRVLVSSEDMRGLVVMGVVISHELWQSRFQGDPNIIGRRFIVNNFDVQVVGVTRPDFRGYLPPANRVEERVDVWLPIGFEASRMYRGLPLLGRLAPGADVARAQAECDALAAAFVGRHPGAYPNDRLRIAIRPLGGHGHARCESAADGARWSRGIRAVDGLRQRGQPHGGTRKDSRARIGGTPRTWRHPAASGTGSCSRRTSSSQVLGGVGGVGLARAGIGILDWLRPVHLPRQADIAIDGVVLLWSVGLTVACSVLFGLVPALFSTFVSGDALGQPLNSGRGGSVHGAQPRAAAWTGRRGSRVVDRSTGRRGPDAAGTFTSLLQAPIGFEPSHVVTARVSLNLRAFTEIDRRIAFFREAIARVRELPGVDAVSVGGPLPLRPGAGHRALPATG